jgi:hypothetical protein
MKRNIVTRSGAHYTIAPDGKVIRARCGPDIQHTYLNRQHTEGYLITNFDDIRKGASFMWYAVEGDMAEVILTSAVVGLYPSLTKVR